MSGGHRDGVVVAVGGVEDDLHRGRVDSRLLQEIAEREAGPLGGARQIAIQLVRKYRTTW